MSNPEHERLLWVDKLCDRFESAWGTENQFSIELMLQNISPEKLETALEALLPLERDFRAGTQKPLLPEEMRERFSDYENVVESVIQQPGLKDSLQPEEETIVPRSSVGTGGVRIPRQLGRYRILRKLGQGAMGSVFLAEDEQLGRKVAIKIPQGDIQLNPELRVRFEREARAAAALDHPNICQLFDIGECDGVHFICMGYVDGFSLSQYAVAESGLSEQRIAQLVLKLATALATAHETGFIHRDLKPANIMVDGNGEPVILDFGLACTIDRGKETRVTQTGSSVGSPAYMSPEQVDGDHRRIGIATDIYSLGVILYELLTGRLPFEGSMASVLGQIMTRQPDKPSDHRKDLSIRLENICLRMMEKYAEDRYPSMQNVVEALQEYLDRLTARPLTEEPSGESSDNDIGAQRRQQIEALIRSAEYGRAEKLMIRLSEETADELSEAAAWAISELPELRKTRDEVRAGRQDIYETADRLLKSCDYEKAARLLEEYPFDLRTPRMQDLLEFADAQANEVERLRSRIQELRNRGDNTQLLAALKALMELKPNDLNAKELQKQLIRRSTGPISRILGNRKPGFMDRFSSTAEWFSLLLGVALIFAYPAYLWAIESLEPYSQTGTKSPLDATTHRNRAKQYFEQSNLTAAAQELTVLTKADAASGSDYEFLAQILERQRRYDEALVMSESAVEQSDHLSVLVQHARLLTYGGQWNDALAELNTLIEQFPDDPMPLMERCEVNGFTQRWADCARDFLHLKEITPFRNHARLGYVVACDALGQEDAALTMLREFARVNQEYGDDADLLGPGIEFGMCPSLSESEYRDMLEDFEATPFADDYFGLLIRGMLHFRLRKTDKAIELLHAAQRLQGNGGTPVSHSFLSMCFSARAEPADAARHLQLAKEASQRMCGEAARPLALKSTDMEPGQPTHWYQVHRFRRAIAEAESLANSQ